MTQRPGDDIARQVGDSHEADPDNPICGMNQDQYNNSAGPQLGRMSPSGNCLHHVCDEPEPPALSRGPLSVSRQLPDILPMTRKES